MQHRPVDSLLAVLNSTGLQISNNALYQVLVGIIRAVQDLQKNSN